jgi:hypothetical protein
LVASNVRSGDLVVVGIGREVGFAANELFRGGVVKVLEAR